MSHYKPASIMAFDNDNNDNDKVNNTNKTTNSATMDRKMLFLDSMEISSSFLKLCRTEIASLPASHRPKELCLECVHFKYNVEAMHVTRFLTVCSELQAILLLGDRDSRYPYNNSRHNNDTLDQYRLVLQSLQHYQRHVLPCRPLPKTSQIRTLFLSRLRLSGQAMGQLLIGAISSHLTDLHITSCYMDLAFCQGFATASSPMVASTTTDAASITSMDFPSSTTTSFQASNVNVHKYNTINNNDQRDDKGCESKVTSATPDNSSNSNRPRANTNTTILTNGSSNGTITTTASSCVIIPFVLPAVPPMKLLELSSCGITDIMMHIMAEENAWEENCLLTLSLKFNALTASSLLSVALLMRQHVATLQEVSFCGNRELFHFTGSATSITKHEPYYCEQHPRETDISCDLDDTTDEGHSNDYSYDSHHEGWQSFVIALGSLSNLQVLDLSHCPMKTLMAVDVLRNIPIACLELNLNYTHLFQKHQPYDDDNLNAMSPQQDQSQLEDTRQHNDSRNPEISQRYRYLNPGYHAFFDALANNQTKLQVLHLQGCNIGNDLILPLFQALEQKNSVATKLQRLDVSGNDFDPDSVTHFPALVELKLPRSRSGMMRQQKPTTIETLVVVNAKEGSPSPPNPRSSSIQKDTTWRPAALLKQKQHQQLQSVYPDSSREQSRSSLLASYVSSVDASSGSTATKLSPTTTAFRRLFSSCRSSNKKYS
ncbi:hypothetical protein ACA910_019063 [Epithemia clementina (nom. ined.)]